MEIYNFPLRKSIQAKSKIKNTYAALYNLKQSQAINFKSSEKNKNKNKNKAWYWVRFHGSVRQSTEKGQGIKWSKSNLQTYVWRKQEMNKEEK